MTDKIQELRLDLAELEVLEKQATRRRVKDIISIEARKLQTELIKLEEALKVPNDIPTPVSTPVAQSQNRRYEVKLNNYAWDQSNKFVKFYVTLNKVQTIPAENITCTFTSKGLELYIKDLDNKDYKFQISGLLKEIVPESSSWRVKTDMVIISASKKEFGHWSYVTEWEMKSKESQKLADTKDMDPADGIMSLMKNMYERGDDEMKRTIAKAWTESQTKGPAF